MVEIRKLSNFPNEFPFLLGLRHEISLGINQNSFPAPVSGQPHVDHHEKDRIGIHGTPMFRIIFKLLLHARSY